ncbi:MAG: hypothetical protein IH849_12670 [Acidobacteria bacterium]|nr:hypothetical protein [Acidobacteriota bacterium]
MSYRRVSQIALVVLTGVLFACSSDTVTPTSPELAGFGTLTGEAKPQSGIFNVSVTGLVNSGGVTQESNPTKLSSTQVVALGMPLDLGFFVDKFTKTDGSNCFGPSFEFEGALAINLEKKNTPKKAVASYFFGALGKDGTTEITYHLQMFGNITGDWLPPAGKFATIALDSWEMKFDTKGGKKQACTGKGEGLASTITVTFKGLS